MARGQGRRSTEDLDPEYWCEGEGLVKVQEWLQIPLTDQDIAKNIGCHPKTLYGWKKRHETFGNLFKKERGVAIVELVNATYKNAKGYYYEEEVLDVKGEKKTIKRWAQPNVTAQQFLIKNWSKGEYRDKWDVEVSGNLPVILKGEDEIPD